MPYRFPGHSSPHHDTCEEPSASDRGGSTSFYASFHSSGLLGGAVLEMDSVTQEKPKRDAKDLASQVVPACTPEAAVMEYFISKFKNHLSKKKPEWDWPPLSPATELVAACRDLEEADRKLEQKRGEAKEKRKQLDTLWQELRDREQQLKQSSIHFNKFVKENREKRERAEKKIQEEKAEQEQRQNEITELQAKVEGLSHMKETLEQHVNKHKMYEDYLKSVVAVSKEYSTVSDILNRFEVLHAARMELTERQQKDQAVLNAVSSNMFKLMEEKPQVILGLNNKLAGLQAHYDWCRAESLQWEVALSSIKGTVVEKGLEIDQVKTSCWNLYQRICRRQNTPLKLEEGETDQQLLHIKRTIQELEKVVCSASQCTRKDLASNVATPSSTHK